MAIMGKVPLTSEVHSLLESNKLDWATIVLGPKGRGYFSAVHDLRSKSAERIQGNIGSNEATLLAEAEELFENTSDYYFWAFVTRKKNYPNQGDVTQLPGKELLKISQDMTQGWQPVLHQLLQKTASDTVIATPLLIATEVKPWSSRNITLLGDAIHSMPPTRGIGGNIALKDAGLLCQKLTEVTQQGKPFAQALDEYVAEMLQYSFKAVKASKQVLNLIVMENPFGRNATKFTLRLVGFLSWLKNRTGTPSLKSIE